MTEPATAATPKALVILPFETAEQAEQFAALVITQMPGAAAPFVLHGTAYEYRSAETGEQGQVIEIHPESRFDAFQGSDNDQHHVLQRITLEAGHAGTEGSPDHDASRASAGEGG